MSLSRYSSRWWIFFSMVSLCKAEIIYQDLPLVPTFALAHGVLMGLAFAIIFPLGAILLRVPHSKLSIKIHIICQVLGVALMIAGLATGVRVGRIIDRLHNNAHTIVGTVVVVFLLAQPLVGVYHHRRFRATQTQSVWTFVHVWLGRIMLVLGIVNGGMGLRLAANTTAGNIAYGVLAGAFGVVYVGVAAWKGGLKLGRKEKKSPSHEEIEI
ncbi:hypothetical protein FE257_005630 [Aspergillus nanangensis]|uniref:Cytochrome b561 domain-containing protein n=1 Tax=Aspergillus nanangensis TaxID=2582783 RepID=A0AAD4CQD9_ASPNN|nr:hypothetical protein FE257_005630 [Aspergillus nanangensis]